jgi:hypothetical protein
VKKMRESRQLENRASHSSCQEVDYLGGCGGCLAACGSLHARDVRVGDPALRVHHSTGVASAKRIEHGILSGMAGL